MRAEHAAIDVRLVDDDEREIRQQVSPRGVVGKDPDVEHVGVGQDQVAALADRGALLAGRVAVVDRRADRLVQAEAVQRAGLILGQRLGRIQVQGARGAVRGQDLQRRQLEAQRFPGRGAGGDDRRAVERGVQRVGLMCIELCDPGLRERYRTGPPRVSGTLTRRAPRDP